MATVASGNVTSSIPVEGVVTLTFHDTSTGITALVSKTLVITNPLGVVLDTVSMGTSLTANYNVTSDQYLLFTLTIIDGNGTATKDVAYVSTAFYDYLFPQLVAAVTSAEPCNSFGEAYQLTRAELNKNAAITMGLFGQGVNSNALIIQANFYLTSPYYA